MGVFSPEQSSSVEDQLPTGSSLFGATFKTIAGAGRGGRCRRRDRGVSTPIARSDTMCSTRRQTRTPSPPTPPRRRCALWPRSAPGIRPAAGGPFEDGPEPSRPLRTSVEEGTPVLEAQPCCCVPREAASLWPTPDRGEELLLRNEAWPGVQGCLRGAAPRLRSREGACLRAPAPQAPAPLPTERTPTSGSWASVLGSGPRPAGPRWAEHGGWARPDPRAFAHPLAPPAVPLPPTPSCLVVSSSSSSSSLSPPQRGSPAALVASLFTGFRSQASFLILSLPPRTCELHTSIPTPLGPLGGFGPAEER